MSTSLALLRAAFWTLPLQRWCTVVGAIMVAIGTAPVVLRHLGINSDVLLGMSILSWLTFGQMLVFAIPALLGGALWRALSAPRRIGLAPRGRARLLCGAIGITLLVAGLVVASYLLFDLGRPPFITLPSGQFITLPNGQVSTLPNVQILVAKVPPMSIGGIDLYRNVFVSAFAAATWWAIASFIGSRSPLATLVVVLVAIGSFFPLDKLGFDNPGQVFRRPWGIAAPLALWLAFGTWYLRARRIAPPGWLLPGGQSVLASVAMPGSSVASTSKRTALERMLLGGVAVPRILAQWLMAGVLLLLLLMLIARQGEGRAEIAAHVAFAALIACPAIVAVQSMAIVQRARALWLPSGYSRSELFGFTERTLLRFALGMSLVFTLFLLLLWYTQPWRPALTLLEALLVVVLPSLQLAVHSLAVSRGWDVYWRWPLVMLLCWFTVWKPLTAIDATSWAGLPGWAWFVTVGIATVSFHLLARRRWLRGDLLRAAASA